MKYIKTFWPAILCLIVFVAYVLSMGSSPHTPLGSLKLYVPLFMMNLAGLPVVALAQLIYGATGASKSKEPHYRLHLFSAIAIFGLWLIFCLLLSLGFYLTV